MSLLSSRAFDSSPGGCNYLKWRQHMTRAFPQVSTSLCQLNLHRGSQTPLGPVAQHCTSSGAPKGGPLAMTMKLCQVAVAGVTNLNRVGRIFLPSEKSPPKTAARVYMGDTPGDTSHLAVGAIHSLLLLTEPVGDHWLAAHVHHPRGSIPEIAWPWKGNNVRGWASIVLNHVAAIL